MSIPSYPPTSMTNGFVYILQHSFMQDVIRIGSTTCNPEDIAENLSKKITIPGKYSVFSSVACENPNNVEQQVMKSIRCFQSVGDFYELSPEAALKIIKRDALRIPIIVSTEVN